MIYLCHHVTTNYLSFFGKRADNRVSLFMVIRIRFIIFFTTTKATYTSTHMYILMYNFKILAVKL